ncbi:phospholipase ABHD3-like [Adelges cooleyi]|uniref:phospholipase ABHD3-like n=2 Tax=Adelges cooleyi TaxID=133065 RepID=UPI00217F7AD9|nr:phospholipase ABHD3-like [Adelges cooleyi]
MAFFVNQILNLSCFFLICVIGSTAIIGFTYYYLTSVVKKPKLYCKEGNFKKFVLQNVPIINEEYWPVMWCFESRFHSILSLIIRSLVVPSINYNREILNLKDGGQVALDWLEPNENSKAECATILYLPGLISDSHSEYVRAVSLALQKVGYRVVVFNYRGVGGVELKTPRSYSANNIEDLTEVVNHLKRKYPKTIVGGLGTSLGGVILGNYLQSNEQLTHKHFSAAMIVSVPWKINISASNIEKPIINRMIGSLFTKELLTQVKNNRKLLNSPNHKWNYNEVIKSKTLREFDRNYTIHMFGYKTVDEYYDSASLHDKINRFHLPCLCLSAADDIFCLEQDIPLEQATTTDNVAILLTARGGHLGFFEGIWPFSEKNDFMLRVIVQYFSGILKNDNYKQFSS